MPVSVLATGTVGLKNLVNVKDRNVTLKLEFPPHRCRSREQLQLGDCEACEGSHGTISQCISGLAFLDHGVPSAGRASPSSQESGLGRMV